MNQMTSQRLHILLIYLKFNIERRAIYVVRLSHDK